jgi:hypothetical protein
MMKCSKCKKEVPDSAKVCGYCGAKIEKKVKHTCPECGKELPAKAKVCGFCGTPLQQKATAIAKPTPVKKAPTKKVRVKTRKLPKWALPAGLGIAALAIVVFFVMKPSSPPETAVVESQQESAVETGAEKDIQVSGVWIGEIEGVTGDFSATLELDIDQKCSVGDICGIYRVLEFDSNGDLELVSISGSAYKFLEHPGQQVEELLEGSGYQTMRLINDTLSWSFEQTLPSGETVESTGTLNRK